MKSSDAVASRPTVSSPVSPRPATTAESSASSTSASNAGGALEQRASRAGQLDPARRPDEQRRAEQRLELAYLRAQRLLRQVEAGRRPREVELLGDRDERTEMAELDTHNREW